MNPALRRAEIEPIKDIAGDGVEPRTVIVVPIAVVYAQCATALRRSGLWTADDQSAALPRAGDIQAEMKTGFDGAADDADRPMRDAQTLW